MTSRKSERWNNSKTKRTVCLMKTWKPQWNKGHQSEMYFLKSRFTEEQYQNTWFSILLQIGEDSWKIVSNELDFFGKLLIHNFKTFQPPKTISNSRTKTSFSQLEHFECKHFLNIKTKHTYKHLDTRYWASTSRLFDGKYKLFIINELLFSRRNKSLRKLFQLFLSFYDWLTTPEYKTHTLNLLVVAVFFTYVSSTSAMSKRKMSINMSRFEVEEGEVR